MLHTTMNKTDKSDKFELVEDRITPCDDKTPKDSLPMGLCRVEVAQIDTNKISKGDVYSVYIKKLDNVYIATIESCNPSSVIIRIYYGTAFTDFQYETYDIENGTIQFLKRHIAALKPVDIKEKEIEKAEQWF